MDLGARALLMACMTFAVALAGCSASGGAVHAPQPEWHSGYAWTYTTHEESSWAYTEDGESENGTDADQWRTVREVLNTTLAADGEPYYIVAAQMQGDNAGRYVQLLRQRDLDPMPYRSSTGETCLQGDCTFSFRLVSVNASTPTFLDFPLERGKRWGAVFDSENAAAKMVYQAEVDGTFAVPTGLGTMQAARVSIVTQLADPAGYRKEVLAEASEEGYKVDDLRFAMTERQLVYYSHDYQAIVRLDIRYEESIYARGVDPDGEAFEFSASESSHLSSVVEGARLVPRAERSLDDVAAFLAGKLDLRDPTGQTVGDVTYKLGVDPPQATINVGQNEGQAFTAVVTGDLPDGHTLHWRLIDAQGRSVRTGTGETFQAAPTAPGHYVVELESQAGNASVAAAGAILVGDYAVAHTVDCGPVTLFSPCVDETLPVHPGARGLYVRVTPNDPVSDGAADALVVVDSAGTRISGTRSGDSFVVQLEPIAGYLVDMDPWSIEFSRGVAALSTAQVEVQVRYGAGTLGDMPAAGDRLGERATWLPPLGLPRTIP